MGSMNMPGVSLSLLNLTNIAEECSFTSTSHLLELIDAPHNTPGWPATQNMYPVPPNLASRKRADQFIEVEKEEKVVHTGGPKLIGMLAQAAERIENCADTSSGRQGIPGSYEGGIRRYYRS
jgi:dihydroxyacetone kinase